MRGVFIFLFGIIMQQLIKTANSKSLNKKATQVRTLRNQAANLDTLGGACEDNEEPYEIDMVVQPILCLYWMLLSKAFNF